MSETSSYPCPRCGVIMEVGFASRVAGLSFIRREKFEHFAFKDEDLARVGTLGKLLPSKAEYFRSYLCLDCQFYLIDYSTRLSRRQADEVAGCP